MPGKISLMVKRQIIRYNRDMKEIDNALLAIEEDYKACLRIIGRYYDYLDTCGLKEFNKYSKFRWSYDRDKSNGYSYVCIRYGNSLMRKVLVKRRAFIENDDLYRWAQNKDLIEEALDEAYQYIVKKINSIKSKIEAMKAIAADYEEKLDDLVEDDDTETFTSMVISRS